MRLPLTICTLIYSEALAQSLSHSLSGDRYVLTQHQTKEAFLNFVEQRKQQLDCLILQEGSELASLVSQLYDRGTLLPVIIFQEVTEGTKDKLAQMLPARSPRQETKEIFPKSLETDAEPLISDKGISFYYAVAVYISTAQLSEIALYIDNAIANFLKLSSTTTDGDFSSPIDAIKEENVLLRQQRRLAEKLRERLGYLGVYYKRNPQNFFRNLSAQKRQEFIDQLRVEYRQIVLEYFTAPDNLNQKIDEFVNIAFFADIAVTYIVEIHMELMDELSKHLKLEGRSDEVLLDYRLTLIDVIAHLCEMYRRSLPKDT